MTHIQTGKFLVGTFDKMNQTEAALKKNSDITYAKTGNSLRVVEGNTRFDFTYPEGKPPCEVWKHTFDSEEDALASLKDSGIGPVTSELIESQPRIR